MQIFRSVVLTCLFCLSLQSASAADDIQRLATKYYELRQDVFQTQVINSGALPIQEDTFKEFSNALLGHLKQAPDWNPENPEWQRLQVITINELKKIKADLSEDRRLADENSKIKNALVQGLSENLTAAQLSELVQFYSTSTGKRYVGVRTKMREEAARGLVQIMALQANPGAKSIQAQAPDPKELSVLFNLFQEDILLMWNLLEPKSGGDRSGLQAIPMTVSMEIQTNFESIESLWQSIPAEERQSLIEWRKSPIAQVERKAISASALSARTSIDVEIFQKIVGERFSQLEKKLRVEMKP